MFVEIKQKSAKQKFAEKFAAIDPLGAYMSRRINVMCPEFVCMHF